jgi:hypothetical protein
LDAKLPPEHRYIRYAAEIPDLGLEVHDEDDLDSVDAAKPFRIVICMTMEASRCLLNAQFLQSDIGFKRIVGFQEFELGAFDRRSRTSMFICARAFLHSC